MSRLVLNTTLVAVSAVLCSGCLQISGEIEQLTKVVKTDALTFQGAQVAAGQQIKLDRSFGVDLESDLWEMVLSAELAEVTFIPRGDIQGFEFINQVKADLQGTQLPQVTLARYEKGAETDQAGGLTLSINRDFDHTEYLKEKANFDVQLDFQAPAADWGVDMKLTFNLDLGIGL